jgi:DNA-binding NarL/FixJ family response regulator
VAEIEPSPGWSVLLVDDNDGFAGLTRLWFERDLRFEVVGVGRDGDEAVDLAAALRPRLVVLDDEMPNVTGLEALSQLREVSPASRIIVYTARTNEDREDLASILGADVLVSKLKPVSSLIRMAVDLLERADGAGGDGADGVRPGGRP